MFRQAGFRFSVFIVTCAGALYVAWLCWPPQRHAAELDRILSRVGGELERSQPDFEDPSRNIALHRDVVGALGVLRDDTAPLTRTLRDFAASS